MAERVGATVVFIYDDGTRKEYTGAMPASYFEAFEKALDIVFKKNADYSTKEDPYRNFRESEKFGVPAHYAVMVRLSDKWSRLCNYFRNGEYQVKDEGVTDTIVDAINYLAILSSMLKEEVSKNEVVGDETGEDE